MVDGQQLDRCDAELPEVFDGKVAAQSGVGAAQLLGNLWAQL